jgi:biopolymer transport protein TolR
MSTDSKRQNANRRRTRRKRLAHQPTNASGAVRSEINVTPFVDVVLVLLIIFMVVTPLLQRGIDVVLPLAQNHAEKKDTGDQIIISVRRDGVLFLGQDQLTPPRLEQQLGRLLQRQPAPPVFINGDARLDFKAVREVMEIAQRAGASGVALSTQTKKAAQ